MKAKERRALGGKTERKDPKKEQIIQYLIVCEGEKTEPSYFEKFKDKLTLTKIKLEVVGTGKNTTSLVKKVQEIKEKNKDIKYIHTWCVFDKDGFSAEDFNNAVKKAEDKGYKVAYSNQAFEYWILLHFNDHQGGKMERKHYKRYIETQLREIAKEKGYETIQKKYDKEITQTFFDWIYSKRETAIKRARNIEERHDNDGNSTPSKRESSTTVFKLVEELLQSS